MWTADDMVDSVFLIYLKNIDNLGFCIRFRSLSTLFIQWGTVNSQTYINLPISATILRYTVSIWDTKDASHFISVTGTADGYIQIVSAIGISTGTCFYLAITK